MSAGTPTADTTTPTPSATMQAWIDADDGTALTCNDILFMAEGILPAEGVDVLRNSSEKHCLGPAINSTRQEAYRLLVQAASDYHSSDAEPEPTSNEVIILPLLPGYSRGDGTSSSSHTHDGDPPDHHHHAGQGDGNPLAHGSWWDYYDFRWRHAGQEPDHIKVFVELEHHWDHFHYDRGFEASLHVTMVRTVLSRFSASFPGLATPSA